MTTLFEQPQKPVPSGHLPVGHSIVYSILQIGRKNAIKGRYLAQHTNNSEREIRSIARDLLLVHDVDVVADTNGFYIAENDEERERFAEYRKTRGIAEFRVYAKMKRMRWDKLMDELKEVQDEVL